LHDDSGGGGGAVHNLIVRETGNNHTGKKGKRKGIVVLFPLRSGKLQTLSGSHHGKEKEMRTFAPIPII